MKKNQFFLQNRRSSLTTKQARQVCLQEVTKKNEFYERTEGLSYGPGISFCVSKH